MFKRCRSFNHRPRDGMRWICALFSSLKPEGAAPSLALPASGQVPWAALPSLPGQLDLLEATGDAPGMMVCPLCRTGTLPTRPLSAPCLMAVCSNSLETANLKCVSFTTFLSCLGKGAEPAMPVGLRWSQLQALLLYLDAMELLAQLVAAGTSRSEHSTAPWCPHCNSHLYI